MRNIVLILLGSWAFFRADLRAQTLSPGYIVTLQSDTLRGFIMDGTDAELALRIQFRKDPESAITEYTPPDLRAFAFDYGREFSTFKTGNVSLDNSESVFAKKDLLGKIGLYTYDKPKATHPDIFLVNYATYDTVHLTPPDKKIIDTEGMSKRISESTQFIGLLAVIKNEPGTVTHQKINYNRKSIRKDILKYNEAFATQYPVSRHKAQKIFRYEFTVGMPILFSHYSYETALRASFFRTTYFPENSRNWSFIRGISYRYWSYTEKFAGIPPRDRIEGSSLHLLSIVPIGFKYEGNGKFVRPYIYLGFALAAVISIEDLVAENINRTQETEFWLTPSINVAAGVKIKTGSKFILMEISPSAGSGPHASLGFCF